jgi:hypothetical protein
VQAAMFKSSLRQYCISRGVQFAAVGSESRTTGRTCLQVQLHLNLHGGARVSSLKACLQMPNVGVHHAEAQRPIVMRACCLP